MAAANHRIKISFVIARTPFFRTLGPIIAAAADDPSIDVTLVLGPPTREGATKAYQSPTFDNVPELLRGRTRVVQPAAPDELLEQIRTTDAALSTVGPAFLADLMSRFFGREPRADFVQALRAATRWGAVYDSTHSVLPDHRFDGADWAFWPSRLYMDMAVAEPRNDGEALRRVSRLVGYVRYETGTARSKDEIRSKLGIPRDRPVVLFIPDGFRFKGADYTTDWYRAIWCTDNLAGRLVHTLRLGRFAWLFDALDRKMSDANQIRAIRSFCDRNDAWLLIARRRRKDCFGEIAFTPLELAVADSVADEGESYPQALPEALQVADLAICGYRSEAMLDALAAAVPYITIAVPDRAFQPYVRKFNHDFDAARGHHPGANWVVSSRSFIRNFADKRIGEFARDGGVMADLRRLFTGDVDGKASARILEVIKNELARSDGTAK